MYANRVNLQYCPSEQVVEDGFKASCLLLHAEVGSLLGDTLVLPLLPIALQKPQILWSVRSLIMLCTISGRYNDCDSYGDALGDVSQSAVSDWMGRQVIRLSACPTSTHGFQRLRPSSWGLMNKPNLIEPY